MAIGYLDSTYLSDIGDAIRAKAGTTAMLTVAEMPTAISNIPSGGGDTPRVFKDVNFFDYDGTILYQYTLQEARALTALPALPASPKEGYTADSWTETLSFIQNLTGPCDVGVNYTCSNTFSEIKLSIPENNYTICYLSNPYASISATYDYGDGTVETVGKAIYKTHTYATKGDYIVKITGNNSNSAGLPVCYAATSNNYSSTMRESGSMFMPLSFVPGLSECNIIKEVWLGKSIARDSFFICLFNCKSIEKIMIPSNARSAGTAYVYPIGSNLKHLTVPSTFSITGQSTNSNLGGPESIVWPSSLPMINNMLIGTGTRRFISYNSKDYSLGDRAAGLELTVLKPATYTNTFNGNASKRIDVQISGNIGGVFQNCKNLESMDLSYLSITALPQSTFMDTISLKSVTLPSTLTTIQSNCFQNSGIENITIPSGVTAIGDRCFEGSALKQITLPSSCWNFADYCFQKCYGLTEIHLTANPNPPELGDYCFAYCYNLASVYIYATALPAQWGTNVFQNTSNVTIYIPNSALSSWQTAFPDYASMMVGWDPQ